MTTFGSGKAGYSDGPHSEAKLHGPTGLCLSCDEASLLCTDQSSRLIRRIDLNDGSVHTLIGSGRLKTNLRFAYSVCAHPIKPNGCFIGDLGSIRYCYGETVSLIAGGPNPGCADGVGGAAKFACLYGLVCASDGQTLYASDSNFRLRCVDLETRTVKTVCGDGADTRRDGVGTSSSFGALFQICFDRSPTTKPDSVLFVASKFGVRRFDIATGTVVRASRRGGFGSADLVCWIDAM